MKRAFLALLATFAAVPSSAQMTMMSVENQRTGAAAYVGPGDVISGARAWWGLRAYTAAYATGLGKIALICTPADAVCANVNANAAGNFNLAGTGSLTCNNSGSICTVKTLFDQSGNTFCSGAVACDLTNATIANRPILVVPGAANGCTNTANYCMKFVATQTLTATAGAGTAQPYVFSLVAMETTAGQANIFFDGANIISGMNSNAFMFDGASILSAAAALNTPWTVQYVFNGGASASNIYVNSTTNGVSIATTGLGGGWSMGSGNTIGIVTELGLWPSSWGISGTTCATCAAMSTNQRGYWGF